MTDIFDRDLLYQFNNAMREKNKGFVYAGNLGLYGFLFVDFGNKHTVFDKTMAFYSSFPVNFYYSFHVFVFKPHTDCKGEKAGNFTHYYISKCRLGR